MRLLLGLVAAIAPVAICAAQTGPVVVRAPAQASVDTAPSNTIQVRPGYSTAVNLNEPFASLVVGDPDLIDALAITDRSFAVRARRGGTGQTNILAINTTGQQIHNLFVVVLEGKGDAGGSVKVHSGSRARWSIHEFASYSCTDDYCVRLPQNRERIRDPRREIILMPGMPAPAPETAGVPEE